MPSVVADGPHTRSPACSRSRCSGSRCTTTSRRRILGLTTAHRAYSRSVAHPASRSYAGRPPARIWGKCLPRGTQNQFKLSSPSTGPTSRTRCGPRSGGFAVLGRPGSRSSAFLLVWILNVALSARDRGIGAGGSASASPAMTFWHVVVNVAMVGARPWPQVVGRRHACRSSPTAAAPPGHLLPRDGPWSQPSRCASTDNDPRPAWRAFGRLIASHNRVSHVGGYASQRRPTPPAANTGPTPSQEARAIRTDGPAPSTGTRSRVSDRTSYMERTTDSRA